MARSPNVFWDSERNTVDENTVTNGSDKKYWWLCNLGHSWESSSYNTNKQGKACPFCSGRKVLIGFNNAFHTKPKLRDLWDFERNIINPDTLTFGSHKKVWWKCKLGHSWESQMKSVANGTGCPVCSGKYVLKGFSDFESNFPELLEYWNYEQNEIHPSEALKSSRNPVFWKCEFGHSWQSAIRVFVKGTKKCPTCYSLIIKHPKIAKQVHPTKNPSLKIEELPEFSPKKIWWLCNKGHEWEALVYSRTKAGNGCPVCSGKKVVGGINDIATTHPELVPLWDHEKNELTPEKVTFGSSKLIWWKCSRGHSTRATVHTRAIGHRCSKCSKNVSKKEQLLAEAVSTFVKRGCKMATSVRNIINPFELDVYIPCSNVALEFNGIYWHDKDLWLKDIAANTSISREASKTEKCLKLGIELIHVWEDDWDKDSTFIAPVLEKIVCRNC